VGKPVDILKRPARIVISAEEHDGPGWYVFASTTGRAVSPRLMGASNFSFRCLRRMGTSSE
jgi:hypothetical protein